MATPKPPTVIFSSSRSSNHRYAHMPTVCGLTALAAQTHLPESFVGLGLAASHTKYRRGITRAMEDQRSLVRHAQRRRNAPGDLSLLRCAQGAGVGGSKISPIYFFISGGRPDAPCCPMGRLAFCSNGSFVWAGRVFDLLRLRAGAFLVPSRFVFAISKPH